MKKTPFYLRLWFFWLVLTVVYSIPAYYSSAGHSYDLTVLGSFVPWGPFTFELGVLGLIKPAVFFAIILTVVLLWPAEKIFEAARARMSATAYIVLRTISNLVILFLLTMVVEYLVIGESVSLKLLQGETLL